MWWFDICIYCESVTSVRLFNISITAYTVILCVCLCVLRTFKIYSLSNFQIYSTVLLTIVTLLYNSSLELINLITESLNTLTTLTHSPSPHPPLAATNLLSVSMSFVFIDFKYKWDRIVFVFFCLTYFT